MPSLSSFDGLSLYYEVDEAPEPKAVALIVHGFGDHCGRYPRLTEQLTSWGITCYRFDYRGHGRSEGKRGHILSFKDYLQDVETMRTRVVDDHPDLPKALLGHSNGGLISLHSASEAPEVWSCVVLSSPFFGIQLKVPLWKRALGRGLSAMMPSFQMPTELHGEYVSHDPEVVEAYNTDPLMGRVASARWFTETIKIHETSAEAASTLKLPILFQVSGDDHLVSLDSTLKVFESVGSVDQKLTVYDTLFHELWFELDREAVMSELQVYLTRTLSL